MQYTLAEPVEVRGIGLRHGRPVRATLRPAAPGAGRFFRCGDVCIPATLDYVVDTRFTTTLAAPGATVSVVEHLGAALYAAGIDNAEIEVEGDEIPILDGSARPWSDAIHTAGRIAQAAPRPVIRVREPVRIEVNGSWGSVEPAEELELEVDIDFPHPAIGVQRWAGPLRTFADQLGWARTFGFLRDADALRRSGMAHGASLENTVVYDDHGVLNPEGLRAPDEAVRHKALDAVGDFSLLGMQVCGRIRLFRAGHAVHVALMRALRDPTVCEVVYID